MISFFVGWYYILSYLQCIVIGILAPSIDDVIEAIILLQDDVRRSTAMHYQLREAELDRMSLRIAKSVPHISAYFIKSVFVMLRYKKKVVKD